MIYSNPNSTPLSFQVPAVNEASSHKPDSCALVAVSCAKCEGSVPWGPANSFTSRLLCVSSPDVSITLAPETYPWCFHREHLGETALRRAQAPALLSWSDAAGAYVSTRGLVKHQLNISQSRRLHHGDLSKVFLSAIKVSNPLGSSYKVPSFLPVVPWS
ncbi:hypothetical protein BV25DRAFT_294087 [Artomyces pyxidatus]|uniref:Uncharacterized protein n=1 Tax=Artomyces pyxidatus TaxID=48021 RepID=A0ACB8T7G9_9AGAM|nr:hypothetical protein BV25DRAFT_294087 [Artomyces pyxidatus]